jgi:hypothetical protein
VESLVTPQVAVETAVETAETRSSTSRDANGVLLSGRRLRYEGPYADGGDGDSPGRRLVATTPQVGTFLDFNVFGF